MSTKTRLLLGSAVAAVTVLAIGGVAAAGPPHASRGDAQAVLNAFGNGGLAVLLHSKTAQGAPAQGVAGKVGIRPFADSPFDGAHYCELDWHTILIADIEEGPRQEAAAIIADQSYAFTLDGASIPVTQTPVKRFLNPGVFGLDDAYYSQWGRVMAPSELTPGQHTLDVTGTNAAGDVVYTDGITFFVDPAGSGTCL